MITDLKGTDVNWDPVTHTATLELIPGEGRLLKLTSDASTRDVCEQMNLDIKNSGPPWEDDGPVMHVSFEELLDQTPGKRAVDHASGLNDVWLEGTVGQIPGKEGFGMAAFMPQGTVGVVFDAYLPESEAMTIAFWVKPPRSTTAACLAILLVSSPIDR